MKNSNKFDKAIALLYDKEMHNAPVVISKGENYIAQRIVDIARENNIPVVNDTNTAYELIKLKVGDEIPYSVYEAVSIILKYVYQLKA